MSEFLTIHTLFTTLRKKLKLTWSGHESELDSPLFGSVPGASNQTMVGHLNCIHPNRIQVIGHAELDYLADLTPISYQETLDNLFAANPAAILFSDGIEVEQNLLQQAEAQHIPVFSSPLEDNQLVGELHYYLTRACAERITVHGVFMEVMGMGVLLTGDASVGKSELALELISRGHRLIADDAPEFAQIAPDILVGSCPDLLREFLEVRGLGILNVRAMFGDSAIKQTKYLRLIIDLKKMGQEELANLDRLRGSRDHSEILGISVPKITVPVAPGRNLAILVEAAVRHHILLLKGYDASRVFEQRQQQMSESEDNVK